uniref:(northern house mosquito) hypothetical protein n=1 Tax=Culex pipiens TaxID=7175 RepID=A0A8D8BL48_CULPI
MARRRRILLMEARQVPANLLTFASCPSRAKPKQSSWKFTEVLRPIRWQRTFPEVQTFRHLHHSLQTRFLHLHHQTDSTKREGSERTVSSEVHPQLVWPIPAPAAESPTADHPAVVLATQSPRS